jgi:hypothetical protein
MNMTREQAIEHLKPCGTCTRWITTQDCDHCWADQHHCPPTLISMVPKQIAALNRAVEIGKQAEACLRELKSLKLGV